MCCEWLLRRLYFLAWRNHLEIMPRISLHSFITGRCPWKSVLVAFPGFAEIISWEIEGSAKEKTGIERSEKARSVPTCLLVLRWKNILIDGCFQCTSRSWRCAHTHSSFIEERRDRLRHWDKIMNEGGNQTFMSYYSRQFGNKVHNDLVRLEQSGFVPISFKLICWY